MAAAARPLITVVISAKERGPDLQRTLHSIARQSLQPIEVIVCGTKDKDVDRDMVTLQIDASRSGAPAWKLGLDRASGDFVCCLMDGDELLPTFLEKCLFLMTIQGSNAGASMEAPPDSRPHVLLLRKDTLKSVGGYPGAEPLEEQRFQLASRLSDRNGSISVISEVLAYPSDPPCGDHATLIPKSTGETSSARLNYAAIVRPPSEHRRTILLAMPFLTMGGAEAIVSQFCRQLKGLEFRILVYTTVPTDAMQGDTSNWFEDHVVGIYHLPRFLEIGQWPAFIAYLIQQHGVSVLWQVGSSYTYDLLPTLRELFPHLGAVDLLFNPVGHTSNHLKYNYLIDHVTTEYNGMKEWLVERGEQEERVSVIPNGVDLELYSPQPKRDWRTLQPRAASEKRFVVGFLGRLSQEKAPDTFLEIAASLTDLPFLEFLVCGSGPMESYLQRVTVERGLADRVHFLGFVSAREYLPCCDVVVVCSRMDGRPNVVMESLAMGIPVVASKVGGIPDMIPAGDRDLLCEPAQADSFAATIRRLASDPDRYLRAAHSARTFAEQHFSIACSGAAYARLFESIGEARRVLDRHLPPQAVATSLGYDRERDPGPRLPKPLSRWRRYSPSSWLAFFRNRLLLRRLKQSGKEQELRDGFDPGYYTAQFPETPQWRRSPLEHYLFYGFREGRNPSPSFNTNYYLSAHPDVRRGGLNPLMHYVMWGKEEGRSTMPASRRGNQITRIQAPGRKT